MMILKPFANDIPFKGIQGEIVYSVQERIPRKPYPIQRHVLQIQDPPRNTRAWIFFKVSSSSRVADLAPRTLPQRMFVFKGKVLEILKISQNIYLRWSVSFDVLLFCFVLFRLDRGKYLNNDRGLYFQRASFFVRKKSCFWFFKF